MKALQITHIALGSNKGDKLKNLQLAIDLIYKTVGTITGIAKVYKTEALGFDGDFFLNTCISVSTVMAPEVLLNQLLTIEKQLGRERSESAGYASRLIDLDIIFHNNSVIETETLIVPHPEAHKRKFVLQPLNDIASEVIHPICNTSVSNLLLTCEDKSTPESITMTLQNPTKTNVFSKYNHIAIEGNIGAGKTSLATKIAQDFNGKLILERFTENPFLSKFYEAPKRYAFNLEMSFLVDRYQQIREDLAQLDLFKDFIISDYDIFKSLIFSRITLQPDEFKLYRKLFFVMYQDIVSPDLYVYLYQNTEQLQANIKKRSRTYETGIENEYLEKINTGYLNFLKNQTTLKTKVIDISNRDFVNSHEDYVWLIEEISA